MRWFLSPRARLGLALGAASVVSVVLWLAGALTNQASNFSFLLWNLALAWVPLGLALVLLKLLTTRRWSDWLPFVVTVLWLGFLPNSFYLVSDFIHLQDAVRADVMLDIVLFGSFAVNGLLLGYISLFMIHQQLLRRISRQVAAGLVALALLVSSFAMYIGRDLRWNTWDVLLQPGSLLFDISDRLLNAHTNPQLFTTTLGFFVFLGSTYLVLWQVMRVARRANLL